MPDAEDLVLAGLQLSKVYPGTFALRDVDFNVYRAKVNVLVGENGAGKSTLMKILAGVEQPTTGQLLLDGQPIEVHSRCRRAGSRHRHHLSGAQPVLELERCRQHLPRARAGPRSKHRPSRPA